MFVDDIDQAIRAIGVGARDLLLRDWDKERSASSGRHFHRPFPWADRRSPGIEIDDPQEHLPKELFTTWLGLVDGSGAARPRCGWAPGKDVAAPVPPDRISAEWMDRAWISGEAPDGLAARGLFGQSWSARWKGSDPTAEVESLFGRGAPVDAVARVPTSCVGIRVETRHYGVNRYINYTNHCYFRCGFCAFPRDRGASISVTIHI